MSVSFLSRRAVFLFLFYFCTLFLSMSQVIDRVLAVVNDQIITLTDTMIVESFGLYQETDQKQERNGRDIVLERLIDQKLVIQLTREEDVGDENDVEAEIERMSAEIGSNAFREKLEQFGLKREDLKEYIREKLHYERIIAKKFNRSVPVSLEEIEAYYETHYVPSQREKGAELQPMTEILDMIEQTIKKEKMAKQVADWVENLRQKAEIQVKYKSEK
jgi:peptidyl-prolyl cis-trans isomerase SurA